MSVRKKLLTKAKWWSLAKKVPWVKSQEDLATDEKRPHWMNETLDSNLDGDELPADIQSRLICHVPDFVWSADVS